MFIDDEQQKLLCVWCGRVSLLETDIQCSICEDGKFCEED
jgi:hypothetical protein